MSILPGIIKVVLGNENSPIRFENFCLELFNKIENIELVPTSRSWDYGRDGRSILLSNTPIKPILCATLREDIEEKVESDILRLRETTKTNSIIYCSSKELSEKKCNSLEEKIRELYPGMQSVRIVGQIQFVGLIDRHDEIFRKYYTSEISNIEKTLLSPSSSQDLKEIGLRLVLCTQVGEDAGQLRDEISKILFIYNLNTSGDLTIEQLSTLLTAQLHLPKSISTQYVHEVIAHIEDEELVTHRKQLISITKKGKTYLDCLPESASSKLLEGRSAVREAINKLSGHQLSNDQYGRLWEIFQDGITELFYNHGLSLVRMVRSILVEKITLPSSDDMNVHMISLAERAVAQFSNKEQAFEVKQAIIDMFYEKEWPAFQWLSQICGTYVMMCSLGLEELSNQQILRILSTYHVIPDSDIIISLLCEGEDNHEQVERIIKGWIAVGGEVMLSSPVLEEVAHHAWISEYDYSHFGVNLNKVTDYDANHIIENAFVRAFRKVSVSDTSPKMWQQYIQQYRGTSENDYSRILGILRAEFPIKLLPLPSKEYDEISDHINKYLIDRTKKIYKITSGNLDFRTLDKIKRDCKLVVSVISERNIRKSQGDYTTSCIISSASLIKELDYAFTQLFGPPEMILPTAAIGFLLTLTPQVSMSFGTLRSVLFDDALAQRLTPAQRFAFRVITSSGQWNLPFSRRGSLEHTLTNTLYREAHSRGELISSIRERVTGTKDPEYSATIVAEVLDKMAITPKSREELIQAKQEIEKLRKQLSLIKTQQQPIKRKGHRTSTFKRK
jgi:hypothetical protein